MTARREPRRNPESGKKRMITLVDFVVRFPDGTKKRVRECPRVRSLRAAEQWERQRHVELLEEWERNKHTGSEKPKKEVPTFSEWWDGRFWREWVVARRNKPGEVESKKSIYRLYLRPRFGHLRLDEIVEDGHIPDFRASLVERVNNEEIGLKRVNNILAPLSKALRYAEDQRIIDKAPRVGMFKVEPPEVVWWDFEQYPRMLAAAREEGEFWYVAVCLAGETGLRIGEIRALRWERDLDLIAGTLTVNEQTRKGVTGTPKGRTRRTLPMTTTLLDAARGLSVVRRGYVIRNPDGSQMTDGQTTHVIYRICRRAGLPEESWHRLRHSYGTHAAMFGVNPWRLMAWMGHKRITETLRYVHVAEDHVRTIPANVVEAGKGEADPDRRIVAMLGARMATMRQQLQPEAVGETGTQEGG